MHQGRNGSRKSSPNPILQVLEEDDFSRNEIAPKEGIKKSSFSEATNSRGLEQFIHVFKNLQVKASKALPNHHPNLGNLVGLDGSLIDATLAMYWADYRKKAKVHVGFDLNRSVPRKIFLTDGNGAERPFVSQILSPGETGVMDRGYQCQKKFDLWHHLTEKTHALSYYFKPRIDDFLLLFSVSKVKSCSDGLKGFQFHF
jgi:hypothetical protein